MCLGVTKGFGQFSSPHLSLCPDILPLAHFLIFLHIFNQASVLLCHRLLTSITCHYHVYELCSFVLLSTVIYSINDPDTSVVCVCFFSGTQDTSWPTRYITNTLLSRCAWSSGRTLDFRPLDHGLETGILMSVALLSFVSLPGISHIGP